MAARFQLLTSAFALVIALGVSDAAAQAQGEDEGAGPSVASASGVDLAVDSGSPAELDELPADLSPDAGGLVPDLSEPSSAPVGVAGRPLEGRFVQMLQEAEKVQAKIEGLAGEVTQMLREARNASDVVQQMCLDDKLNQIDVAGQSTESNVNSMRAAAEAGDVTEVQRAFSVVQALAESTASLSGEANQCIGEQKKFVGGASLNVTVDPAIPRGDTTGGGLAVPPTAVPNTVEIQEPPLPVSPVM